MQREDTTLERRNEPRIAKQSMQSTDLITVLVLSDRKSLVEDLIARLTREQDIKAIGKCTEDPALHTTWLEQCSPKVLLLDKILFDRIDSQPLRMFRTKLPRVRVLLLGGGDISPDLIREIVYRRVHGYLPASSPPEACLKAIRGVSRGDIWLPRHLLVKVVSDLLHIFNGGNRQPDAALSGDGVVNVLTSREQQIVALLGQGLSNKEIARQLGIMEDTVKKHLQKVFDKLGVRRRSLLVLRQFGRQLANG